MRHQHVELWIVARNTALGDVIGHQTEPRRDAVHVIIVQAHHIHDITGLSTQCGDVIGMHKDHVAFAVNAAIAVIHAVDGGVVLIVRAEGLQHKSPVFATQVLPFGLLGQRIGREGRAPGGGVPFAL